MKIFALLLLRTVHGTPVWSRGSFTLASVNDDASLSLSVGTGLSA